MTASARQPRPGRWTLNRAAHTTSALLTRDRRRAQDRRVSPFRAQRASGARARIWGCDWHETQTGGASPNRGPNGGNPTPRRQGHGGGKAGAGGRSRTHLHREDVSGGSRRCAARTRTKVKRREASASGRLAPSSESPISVGGVDVRATGSREGCDLLPSEVCRAPRER